MQNTTIKTKSVEYMPILLVFFLFLNGCVWFTFALLVTDIFVMVSVLGILSFVFMKKDGQQGHERMA